MSPMRSRHARLFAISLFLVVLTASATQARRGQEAAAAPLATPNPTAAFLDPLDDFDPARWHKADWCNPMPPFWNCWRPDHITFQDGQMRIRLDDAPCPDGCDGRPYASGEYRSNDFYSYGRFEVRLKASNTPGTVTAFFVYTGPYDGNPNDEFDIEILGKDPTRLQTNFFTNGVGSHETWIDLGFDASQAFHTYAIEWTPTALRWYVDGVLRQTENGSNDPLPVTPGRIMMSLWACMGVQAWCGDFAYGGTPVDVYYDWVAYTPMPRPLYLPLVLRASSLPPRCSLIEDFEDTTDEWHAEMGNGAVCGFGAIQGNQGRGMDIDCATHDADDWWFVAKTLDQDWRSAASLDFMLEKHPAGGDFCLALQDADDEVWYKCFEQNGTTWDKVTVSLSELALDPYDHEGNGILDLGDIQQFRFRHWPLRAAMVDATVDELRLCSGATPTPTPTPTDTPTPTPTPRVTITCSITATRTPTPTFTHTPSPTATYTPTPTNTATAAPTATPSPSPTFTRTPSATPTRTPSATPTATWTPSPTPTKTMTYTPAPTATPTYTPTAPPDGLLENFEHGLQDWYNPNGDLDHFGLTNDAHLGTSSLRIGGAEESESWTGEAVLYDWGARPHDWQGKQSLSLWLKRGEFRRGGRPSLTVVIQDGQGRRLQLHRDNDQDLPWPGGGWRTIVENDIWQQYVLPLRHEANFDWMNVVRLHLELRLTYRGSNQWDPDPDDLYVDDIRLQ